MTKYYKILNEKECHHGLQYKTGLNKDILPFNPKGSCSPGGIYFTDAKNIMDYSNYGPWIREVTLPKDALVYQEDYKWKANKVILGKRRKWSSIEVLKELVENGWNFRNGEFIKDIMYKGNFKLFKKILDICDKKLVIIAIKSLHVVGYWSISKAIQILLPYIEKYNISIDNYFFSFYSFYNCRSVEIMRYLKPHLKSKNTLRKTLYKAISYGNHIAVAYLCDKVDLSFNNYYAFRLLNKSIYPIESLKIMRPYAPQEVLYKLGLD